MSRTKSGYFIPTKKRLGLCLSHLQTQKKTGWAHWQLFCSVLCRFSCHPLTVLFWAPSCSNAAAICDVWFALPPPLPRAEPHIYFYVQWTLSSGRATCGCEQRLLTEQLLHNHTHSACLLTPHSPPHRHHVPQHMEGCGVWTAHSTKPRGYREQKNQGTPVNSSVLHSSAGISHGVTLKTLQTSLLVLLLMHFPLLALTPKPHVSGDKMQNYEHNAKCWKIVFISTQFT